MNPSILAAMVNKTGVFSLPKSVRTIPRITVEMRFTSREESLEYMISNGNRNDPKNCTIITGDGENTRAFVVSRELLRASSFVLPMNILDQPQAFNIHYLDINSDIFSTLLKHISLHTEWKFDGSISETKLLLETACKFQLGDFIQHIYSELVPKHSLEGIGFLSVRTACKIYEATRGVEGAEDFKAAAIDYILRNALKVFQDNSFVKLSTVAVAEILSRDDISVDSEVDIFDAMLRWHHADEDIYLGSKSMQKRNLRKYVKESILDCIRFPNFQPYIYFGLIQRWRLLSSDEEKFLYSVWTATTQGVGNKYDDVKPRAYLKASPRNYIRRPPPPPTGQVLKLRTSDLKKNNETVKLNPLKIDDKSNQKKQTEVQQGPKNITENDSMTVSMANFLKEATQLLGDIRQELQQINLLKRPHPARTPGNPKSRIEGWGWFGDEALCNNWSTAD